MRNLPEQLKLKVHNIPCLCTLCIMETGNCANSSYADPWHEVKLVPAKRQSILTHRKRKNPVPSVQCSVHVPHSGGKCCNS